MRGHSGSAPVANSLETHKLPTFLPRLLGLLSAKDTVINSLTATLHYAALTFQIAFTQLIAFYSVRVQEEWAGTGTIIFIWMRTLWYTEEKG